ncbi:putative pentatricopeptide repeat-containing protein At3g23330 [Tasmannia lanceolata]|uniref:putative pentatricopeptide repeat-containing protein At3g23330 n=1 Tax=Tasmannia lanceolata TaxID=3420 RepID=UPI0040628045
MEYRDCIAWNIMIRGYIDNGRITDAREMFDKMCERNTVSWNTMIMAYTSERKMHVALKLFIIMPAKDKDIVTWTTIISGLAQGSLIADSWQLFKQMPDPNSITWSAIISGFQQSGLASEALILFKEMLSLGKSPNSHSFTSVLAAAADLAALSIGQQLYSQALKRGLNSNTHVVNSAISMFMKSGSLDTARCVFNGMLQPDIVTWNSMIMGYGQHGYGAEAIILFHKMQKLGFLPDKISFLGVLQGCSHCGFVEEGWQYFNSMRKDHQVFREPGHYACMVDILARAGMLKEAAEMIDKMPFEPVAIFWRTLLNGCRIFGDLELGVYAAERVLELESDNAAACLMVMEMYAAVGRWVEVSEMRRCMREREAKKEFGFSSTEIKGQMHLFTARDESHPKSESIYTTLELLQHGVPDYIEYICC